ncbi:ATP-dependent helicase [Edaphobacter acidisoli]|uniref:DNA 3'-5' helicase n=1 Tax=Edaphobacter acidisoli TaxID=2040573 RepID=A0A916W2B4_9BACT|nr:UvrD-helicase domain-containing protein [Edaphobacter acidisoli]GGA60459.1 ATP-dependent helicase [Edaphobacter acidisoli]
MGELFLFPNPDVIQPTTEETLPPDWQARRDALDVHRSWIVEAPAGSGKTGLLIQRFLKLLADESVQQPEQVLAITFTVKATAEMRERIVKQLQLATGSDQSKTSFERETRALAQVVLRRDQMLGWELLNHPRRLNIRTIHSVCGEIARSLPVLSGAGGALSPVEDASVLYQEAARRTLMQLGGTDAELSAALRTLLLHRDGNLVDCERLLMEIFSLRDQWGGLIPLSGGALSETYLDGIVRTQLQRVLEQSVQSGLARLTSVFPKEQLTELTALVEDMAHAPGYQGSASPIAHFAGIHIEPGESVEELERWRSLAHILTTNDGWRKTRNKKHLGFEFESHHALRLRNLHDDLCANDELFAALRQVTKLPPAQYPDEQWAVIKVLFRVLRRALAELQLVFAEHDECDFTELELLAHAALNQENSSNALAESLGVKFQHLLVDEMQDTSTIQYQLLEMLTRGWDGQSQTIFLVGDPKQSIYLFRHARVERFVRTMLTGEFGDLPIERLQLTTNFRSQSGLVSAFNEDFSKLFPSASDISNPEEVPYARAVSRREPSSDAQNIVWHGTVLPPKENRHNSKAAIPDQSHLDAESIRSTIELWRSRPLPSGRTEPWKIAVLVRTKHLLNDIIAELKASAIAYRAVDIESLGDRQEVLDLFALTRALLHPADRTAWLAVLRAPWCGLSLAELHLLAGADNHDYAQRSMESLIDERGDLLSEESCERLTRLWPIMRAAADKQTQLTASQLVERTWRSLGGDAYLGANETANALRYLQLLAELEMEAGDINLPLLQRRMASLFANTSTTENAVDLLTIHKAKGLEWDLVIVPGMEKSPRRDRGRLLSWEELNPTGENSSPFVLAPIAGKGEGSKILNAWIQGIHSAREIAEQKRLFYVACTRAKEELHLFAAPRLNAKGEIRPPSGSLLETAWPAAQKHFSVSPTTQQASAQLHLPENASGLALAASGNASMHPRLQRLPLAFHPQSRFKTTTRLPSTGTTLRNAASFTRPEGSFEARVLGNTVHAFLEQMARRVASGTETDQLLLEIVAWKPRIIAVLRAESMPPNRLERYAQQVITALTNALQDAAGRWILAFRKNSSSEFAITSWQKERTSVRLDRIFRAGTEPLTEGDNCVWIVDYKTTLHVGGDIGDFLAGERARYEGQLTSYARIIRTSQPGTDIRVALYFPMLPKLIWWEPDL